jgi:hypothetical protein
MLAGAIDASAAATSAAARSEPNLKLTPTIKSDSRIPPFAPRPSLGLDAEWVTRFTSNPDVIMGLSVRLAALGRVVSTVCVFAICTPNVACLVGGLLVFGGCVTATP